MSTLLILASSFFASTLESDKAAEKLFQEMKKRILKAKTVKLVSKSEIREKKQKTVTINGIIHLSTGNRARAVFESKMADKKHRMKMVCDGKNHIVSNEGKKRTSAVSSNYTAILRTEVAQAGSILMFLPIQARGAADEGKNICAAYDFKLGKMEMVGKRKAQILNYNLQCFTLVYHATVWIDAESKLPLKRVFRLKGDNAGDKSQVYTESTTFVIDSKLDDKLFRLPKSGAK